MSEKKGMISKNNRFSLLNDDDSDEAPVIKTKQDEIKKPTTNLSNLTKNTQKNNDLMNKIEESMIKEIYGKKETKINKSTKYNNQGFYNNQGNNSYHSNHGNNHQNNYKNTEHQKEENEFVMVSNKKKDKIVVECVFKEIEEDLMEKSMANYYRILAHHNDDKNWDLLSHHNITTLKKWEDIPKFFNTLNVASGECNYSDFDIFMMKNDVTPLWEDQDNRNGCICSVRIDNLLDNLEEAYELFKKMAYYMVNNTLLKFSPSTWDIVNGLSFSPRRLDHINPNSCCVVIKIWLKSNIIGHIGFDKYGGISEREKQTIEKYINDDISQAMSKYSVKFKAIKPEY